MRAGDKLRAKWSRREHDILFHFPLGRQTQCDAGWLAGVLNNAFLEELQSRGYDITTIKFSVEPTRGNSRFASQREDKQ